MSGMVYLVGAGPGDPGLLTLKAARILESADVVVYDHLVADAILDRLPSLVERIYGGKETGSHTMDQETIHAVLAERARRGQTVVC
ncbi:MAG: uroporphyrinogen-III C-methyltransferase, partial [Candidatus Rokuibacteriota bacterium]